MPSVDLSTFDNTSVPRGRSRLVHAAWYFLGQPLARWSITSLFGMRCAVLRTFGAAIGHNVNIKPGVRVKYPWKLSIGDHAWVGEDVWIDNIGSVSIGAHACISQSAYLCTGNHDWSNSAFRFRIGDIVIGEGAWVGAKVCVGPNVTIGEGAVITLGSVLLTSIGAHEIHSGNPARFVRMRLMAD